MASAAAKTLPSGLTCIRAATGQQPPLHLHFRTMEDMGNRFAHIGKKFVPSKSEETTKLWPARLVKGRRCEEAKDPNKASFKVEMLACEKVLDGSRGVDPSWFFLRTPIMLTTPLKAAVGTKPKLKYMYLCTYDDDVFMGKFANEFPPPQQAFRFEKFDPEGREGTLLRHHSGKYVQPEGGKAKDGAGLVLVDLLGEGGGKADSQRMREGVRLTPCSWVMNLEQKKT